MTLYDVCGKWKAMLTVNMFHKNKETPHLPPQMGKNINPAHHLRDEDSAVVLYPEFWSLGAMKLQKQGEWEGGAGRNEAFGSTERWPLQLLSPDRGSWWFWGSVPEGSPQTLTFYQLHAWESISPHSKLTALIRVQLSGVCGTCFLRS